LLAIDIGGSSVMADQAPEPDGQSAAAQTRPTADKRYPKYDLITCVALADKVKNQGGNDCSVDQLGAYLGYTNTKGGGFATKVANARMFGLIETVQGRYRITPRAETILYPSSEAEREQALSEAFLAVPMYNRIYEMHRGQRLPEALGMRNVLHREFQVPMGDQSTLAMRVMMDSAEQAGMFKATQGQRTKLILPAVGGASAPSGQRTGIPLGSGGGSGGQGDGTAGAGGGGGLGAGQRTSGVGRGALIDGVLEALPSSEGWEEDLMADWLKMLELALRVRYKLPSKKATAGPKGGDA
jgi:hypothetical protein